MVEIPFLVRIALILIGAVLVAFILKRLKRKKAEKPAVTRPSNTARPYCLVLASRVKKANAEEFVKKLKDRGFKDTEIYIHNNVVRVTYGHFRTEDEAYSERNNLRFEDDFTEAWVYKKTNV